MELSSWLDYFMKLGEVLGKGAVGQRHVVALSIPSRCCAAVFCAAGFIVTNRKIYSEFEKNTSHFERLCSLEMRTPLTVLEDEKRHNGMFVGVHQMDGKRYVKVLRRTKDQLTFYYGEDQAHKVIVSSREKADVPVRQAGRKFAINKNFLTTLLEDSNIDSFVSETNLYCDIFGIENTLRTEAELLKLVVEDGQKVLHHGSIQEILRIKGISDVDYGCHAEIISSSKNNTHSETEEHKPKLSIFDGALPFLKWRDYRRDSSWIILLDRTDRNFDEATSLVRSEFISSRRGEDSLSLPTPLPGIEALQYYE